MLNMKYNTSTFIQSMLTVAPSKDAPLSPEVSAKSLMEFTIICASCRYLRLAKLLSLKTQIFQ